MTNKANDGWDIINEDNVPKSNWFKFEKVGDKVVGIFVEKYHKAGVGDLQDQIVYVLETPDGETVNVGIKAKNDFVNLRLNKARAGDKMGFLFEKEIPPTAKGKQPAKSIKPYLVLTPEGDAVRADEKLMA
jgi:hypothetical protein